ncbi:MAG: RNA polymerase sigma factor [bacterium]|nr:RNA polymerase sigma factor [bacterium]
MMSDENDMVNGLRAGDPIAVAWLVDTFGRRLLRTAVLLCGCEPDAQDAVQETLITALKAIPRFRGGSTLSTWLHGILINVTRHIIRARKPTASLEAIAEPVAADDPAGDCARQDDAHAVRAAVAALPLEHREIIVLRYFHDLKIDEIAAQLGLRSGTVKSRLHYATQSLRALLPHELRVAP